MGNQQPSVLTKEDSIIFLAVNARFGDGSLWKHPECTNYKMIFTSTTPELLQAKYNICPDIFTTGVKPTRLDGVAGRYANAKPMYRLASTVHPLITEIHEYDKLDLLPCLTLDGIALWYLDDGCCVRRSDSKSGSYRFSIAIGDTCNTPHKEQIFTCYLQNLFQTQAIGRITINNSKATENNKSWIIPHPVARQIIQRAKLFKALEHKCPVF